MSSGNPSIRLVLSQAPGTKTSKLTLKGAPKDATLQVLNDGADITSSFLINKNQSIIALPNIFAGNEILNLKVRITTSDGKSSFESNDLRTNIDTTSPQSPQISKVGDVAPGFASVEYSQNRIYGTAESSTVVSIYAVGPNDKKLFLGATTTDATGNFVYALTAKNLKALGTSLVAGTDSITSKSIIATSTDASGNVSALSQLYKFLTATNLTISSSGLITKNIAPGTGVATSASDILVVDYTGYLQTGEVFDSSTSRNKPFVFQLGANRVISGWEQGLADMRPGGARFLIIPPSLGYGDQAAGSIPANSTLAFNVKLRNIFNPSAALSQWYAFHGSPLSIADASSMIMGGYSSNGTYYTGIEQKFGNSVDSSSSISNSMVFSLSSGDSNLTSSNSVTTFLFGGTGKSTLKASGNAPQFMFGGTSGSVITGGAGDDWLQGGGGVNILSAGAGNDLLVSGIGIDSMTGGDGSDCFIFNSLIDLAIGSKSDIISDFVTGIDKLVFANIDADTTMAGDQAFVFVGANKFTAPAQLRFDKGAIYGNVNGDNKADFSIGLTNISSLNAQSDLIL